MWGGYTALVQVCQNMYVSTVVLICFKGDVKHETIPLRDTQDAIHVRRCINSEHVRLVRRQPLELLDTESSQATWARGLRAARPTTVRGLV
jgi:hypothetical protein